MFELLRKSYFIIMMFGFNVSKSMIDAFNTLSK